MKFLLPGAGPFDPHEEAFVTLRDPFRLSLRTADSSLAKRRQVACEEQFAALVRSHQDVPHLLSHEQIVALAGEWYHELVALWRSDPVSPKSWELFREHIDDAMLTAMRDKTQRAWLEADRVLGLNDFLHARGIRLHPETHQAFRGEASRALKQGARVLARMAKGDYRPDPDAERFPQWKPRKVPAATGKGAILTFDALFDRWKNAGGKAPSTVSNWRSILDQFKAFLGHDAPSKVEQADVIRWKDELLKSGRQRINDTAIACLRAIYAVSVAEQAVTGIRTNPALGVSARQSRRQAGQTKLPYTDGEVAAILELSAKETLPARRWLPWLLAFTGARVGELTQLWAESVTVVDGVHVVKIAPAPDGGTLKNEVSERTIPLHPDLIRQGFLRFVQTKGTGPLFYAGSGRRAARARSDDERRHPSKGTSNHLASWIRKSGFTDERKAPSHAFRHWMKTALMKARVSEKVADAIQGHANKSEADGYRHVDLAMMHEALSLIAVPVKPE